MINLIMPKMGESVAEATILKWLKKEGDRIEADEPGVLLVVGGADEVGGEARVVELGDESAEPKLPRVVVVVGLDHQRNLAGREPAEG